MTFAYLLAREWIASAPERVRREEGQGMVEYALILVLIAVVVILVITNVGRKTSNVFSNVSSGLSS